MQRTSKWCLPLQKSFVVQIKRTLVAAATLPKRNSILAQGRPGGSTLPKSYVDVPAELWKSDLLYTSFFAKLPTHQDTIYDRKAPKVLFTIIVSKYQIGAPSPMKTPRSVYQILWKSALKAGTYAFTMSMWDKPPYPHPVKTARWHLRQHEVTETVLGRIEFPVLDHFSLWYPFWNKSVISKLESSAVLEKDFVCMFRLSSQI